MRKKRLGKGEKNREMSKRGMGETDKKKEREKRRGRKNGEGKYWNFKGYLNPNFFWHLEQLRKRYKARLIPTSASTLGKI